MTHDFARLLSLPRLNEIGRWSESSAKDDSLSSSRVLEGGFQWYFPF
jgi:hypothetical protein